jgi:hypothetical protein
MTAVGSAIAASDGTSLQLGPDAWRSLAGTTFAGAAWGLIGLGLGTLIRSQIVATVGGLVWLMGIEDAVRGWLGDLGGYLPGQAGLALAIGSTSRASVFGIVTMLVYVGAIGLLGALAFRRDVT